MKQRCLVLDIETAPMKAYVWQLKNQFLGVNQIVEDWYVLAWAAKWLGDPPSKIMYEDLSKARNPANDRIIVASVWKLLNEADIVISQNGERFDSRKLNARFIEHGLMPPSPYTHLDTYKILRKVAEFSSHKLEYLTKKLCVKYKKLAHSKFPGMELWSECLKGNQEAWKEMKKYNIHDVLSTEELYMKIRAWTPQVAPNVHIGEEGARICTVCGSDRLKSLGIRPLGIRFYRRLLCLSCGRWDREIIKP